MIFHNKIEASISCRQICPNPTCYMYLHTILQYNAPRVWWEGAPGGADEPWLTFFCFGSY